MEVTFRNLNAKHKVRYDPLRRAVEEILRKEGFSQAEVSILFVDDPCIEKLNRQYRDVKAPTDVLSFPMLEGPCGSADGRHLGDIVISLDTAARQAKAFKQTLGEEVLLLTVHGLLHLLGRHDSTEEETRILRELKQG